MSGAVAALHALLDLSEQLRQRAVARRFAGQLDQRIAREGQHDVPLRAGFERGQDRGMHAV